MAIAFVVLRIQKYVDQKYGPSFLASDFLNCFFVVLVGLVCVKESEANGRGEGAWFRHPRTGGVSPAMSNRHRCCRRRCAAAAAAAAVTAAAAAAACCCCCGYRFHMEKPSQPRRRP